MPTSILRNFCYILLFFCAHLLQAQDMDLYSEATLHPWNAGKIYDKGSFSEAFVGKMHRSSWSRSIMLPELAIGENAKYRMVSSGESFHLEDNSGLNYTLSTIDIEKRGYPNAAIFPYGSFLANAFAMHSGIPTLPNGWVFIPDHPSLGQFRSSLAKKAGILTPAETASSLSTTGLLNRIKQDPTIAVDAVEYLRIRLLAIWLGDWEQGSNHLRWIQEEGVFRPKVSEWRTPFFAFDGLLPRAFNRKWSRREWQNFDEKIRDLEGLVLSSNWNDRRLLLTLRKETWIQVVRKLRESLGNEDISRIVARLPEGVSENTRARLVQTLEMRKYSLETTAMQFYALLHSTVFIEGSREADEFSVQRLPDGGLEVRQFYPAGSNTLVLQRNFAREETDEVVIFGGDGPDIMQMTGSTTKGLKVRLVGGEGHDVLRNQIGDGRLLKQTVFYDTEYGNTIDPGRNARVDYSLNNFLARPDSLGFRSPLIIPRLHAGYNIDDKFYLGGSATFLKYGYGRSPYAALHRLHILGSFERSTVEFGYVGDFTNVFGPFGIRTTWNFQVPHYTTYHGEGNATERSTNSDFHEVRWTNIEGFLGLTNRFKHGEFFGGPTFRWVDVEEQEETLLSEELPVNTPDIFDNSAYIGARLGIRINTLDDYQFPQNGIDWITSMDYVYQGNNDNREYSSFHSQLTGYYTFFAGIPFTLGGRIGAGINTGDYAFYQAQTLGGGTGYMRGGSIRGYVRDRFRGSGTFYQNIELRAQVVRFPVFQEYVTVGVSGFFDNGRVYSELEDGSQWHNAAGIGIFFRPNNMAALEVSYASSEEQSMWLITLGLFLNNPQF